MSYDLPSLARIQLEVEKILKTNKMFGSMHRVEPGENDSLVLIWDDATLRAKSKANPGPYLEFMENIADALAEYGYALVAEEDANEKVRNNYLLIMADEGLDDDEEIDE